MEEKSGKQKLWWVDSIAHPALHGTGRGRLVAQQDVRVERRALRPHDANNYSVYSNNNHCIHSNYPEGTSRVSQAIAFGTSRSNVITQ